MYNKKYRSEELREITLRENINNYKTTIIYIFIFIILTISVGFFVSYPEKISGNIFIVSNKQVNNVFSPNEGKIQLFIKENQNVKKGDILAIIDTPASYDDIKKLKKELAKFDVNDIEKSIRFIKYDNKLRLGNIEKQYYTFLLAILEFENILDLNISTQRIKSIKNKIKRNKEKKLTEIASKKIIDKKSKILNEIFFADSILFSTNSIIKSEIDKSKIGVLNIKESKINSEKRTQELTHINEQLLDEILLLKKDKRKEFLSASFNVKKYFFELKNAVDFWERNFIIYSPIDGEIEFSQPFINSNQFIGKNTPLFILLPKIDIISAKGIMSANGYGSLSKNDTIYLKLNDYPFKEFGDIKGVVYNKSKVYHDSIYYLDIKLPNGLLTSQDKTIDFSFNMSGQFEFYTKKRSIIQRIFSSINDSFNKK